MKHQTYVRMRIFSLRRHPHFIASCETCDWEYDGTHDRLDAIGMAKVHAERAGAVTS